MGYRCRMWYSSCLQLPHPIPSPYKIPIIRLAPAWFLPSKNHLLVSLSISVPLVSSRHQSVSVYVSVSAAGLHLYRMFAYLKHPVPFCPVYSCLVCSCLCISCMMTKGHSLCIATFRTSASISKAQSNDVWN